MTTQVFLVGIALSKPLDVWVTNVGNIDPVIYRHGTPLAIDPEANIDGSNYMFKILFGNGFSRRHCMTWDNYMNDVTGPEQLLFRFGPSNDSLYIQLSSSVIYNTSGRVIQYDQETHSTMVIDGKLIVFHSCCIV